MFSVTPCQFPFGTLCPSRPLRLLLYPRIVEVAQSRHITATALSLGIMQHRRSGVASVQGGTLSNCQTSHWSLAAADSIGHPFDSVSRG